MSEIYRYGFTGDDMAALKNVYINDIGDEDVCSVKLGLFLHQKNILSREDKHFTNDSIILYRRLQAIPSSPELFQLNLHVYGDEDDSGAVQRFRQRAAPWNLKKTA